MISKEQFMTGVLKYADNEVIPHLPTVGKWGVGTMIVLAQSKTEIMLDHLITHPVIKSLGIANETGEIDIDSLASALHQSAEKYGKMQVDVPIVGTLTFSASDVDKMKQYINGGERR